MYSIRIELDGRTYDIDGEAREFVLRSCEKCGEPIFGRRVGTIERIFDTELGKVDMTKGLSQSLNRRLLERLNKALAEEDDETSCASCFVNEAGLNLED